MYRGLLASGLLVAVLQPDNMILTAMPEIYCLSFAEYFLFKVSALSGNLIISTWPRLMEESRGTGNGSDTLLSAFEYFCATAEWGHKLFRTENRLTGVFKIGFSDRLSVNSSLGHYLRPSCAISETIISMVPFTIL